jgi:hypothetical protein
MIILRVTKFLHKLASQNCPAWCGGDGDESNMCNACMASMLLVETDPVGDAHQQEDLDLSARPGHNGLPCATCTPRPGMTIPVDSFGLCIHCGRVIV